MLCTLQLMAKTSKELEVEANKIYNIGIIKMHKKANYVIVKIENK